MTASYWDQFSHIEIMSMHGIELEEIDNDIDFYHEEEEEEENYCSDSMEDLGLSYSEFT